MLKKGSTNLHSLLPLPGPKEPIATNAYPIGEEVNA
jgi:hypothetical protein